MPGHYAAVDGIQAGYIMQSHRTTAAKTVTYRTVTILITCGLMYAISGSLPASAAFATLDQAVKMVFYYFHERAWASAGQKAGGKA